MIKLFTSIFIVLLIAVSSGCMSISKTENDQIETLPWNSPSSWEENSFGIPY
ncbi:MAG: hypothetical protein U9O87_02125 [Verrucomicrobiota bacterium]|nr:hypothetical protein [Verrucomicrobiota bacterium]